MPFTRHNAERKEIITAAEEDKPPMGSEPEIMAVKPFFKGNIFDKGRARPLGSGTSFMSVGHTAALVTLW